MSLLPRSWRSVDCVDLSEDSAFLLVLLDDTLRWRQRLVETIELESMHHARVASSYQVEFPPDLVRPFLGGRKSSSVRVLLPITTRPKRALLTFDLVGPSGSPAHLLPRSSIAALEAEYLRRVVVSSSARDDLSVLSEDLLTAICEFSPAVYESFIATASRWRRRERATAAYLSEGLGFDVPVEDVAQLLELEDEIASKLAAALDERPEPLSSSEHVLLALPRMLQRPQSVAELIGIFHGYQRAVEAAARANDVDLLVALADYGRRWEVIAELEMPLNQPATVKLVEDRPLGLGWRARTTQTVAMKDARTFHLEALVRDHAVEIRDFDVRTPTGAPVRVPPLESARATADKLALYSADGDRPYYALLTIWLRSTAVERSIVVGLLILIVSAVVVGARLPDREEAISRLGILVVPTTFASALLFLRERTSLAVRVQRSGRALVALATAVLWVILLFRVVTIAYNP